MSSYIPPDEIAPIFNPFNFKKVEEQSLTPSIGDKLYLKYPQAQGTENMLTMNVGGVATFLSEAVFNDPVEMNNSAVITGETTFNQPSGNTSELLINDPVEMNDTLVVNQTTTLVSDVLYNSTPNLVLLNSSTGQGVSFFTSANTADYGYSTQLGQMGMAFNGSTSILLAGSLNNSIQLNSNDVALWAGGTGFASPSTSITTNGTNNIISNTLTSQSTTTTLDVVETSTQNTISYLLNPDVGNYNPMTILGTPTIVSKGQNNTSNLLLTNWSSTTNGLLLTPTSVLLGSGGNSSTPTSYVECNGSSVVIEPSITYPTGRVQDDAFTGAGGLAGSYTNANLTINSNGQITALSNGSAPAPTATIPSGWCYISNFTGNYPTTVNFTFTGTNWNINQYFTIQFQIGMEWGTLTASGTYPNYSSLVGYIDFYPNRAAGSNSTPPYAPVSNINNYIEGNNNYNYTNATYAPLGRYYWSYGTSFQGSNQGVFIYSNGYQSSLGFQIMNPNGSGTNLPFNLSQSYTIVNKGNGQPIAIQNLNQYTSYGSYGF